MRYVAIAHRDTGTAYGLTIPDVPGCFTAGDSLEEAVANASEALALHLEGEVRPKPRDLDAIFSDPTLAEQLGGGALVYVSYPYGPDTSRDVVSLAPDVLAALDEAARRTGMSRDYLLDEAVRVGLKETIQPA